MKKIYNIFIAIILSLITVMMSVILLYNYLNTLHAITPKEYKNELFGFTLQIPKSIYIETSIDGTSEKITFKEKVYTNNFELYIYEVPTNYKLETNLKYLGFDAKWNENDGTMSFIKNNYIFNMSIINDYKTTGHKYNVMVYNGEQSKLSIMHFFETLKFYK